MKQDDFEIRWSNRAVEDLNHIYNWILQESEQAAKSVKKGLIQAASELKRFPERFPPEPFLKSLPGNFRFILKWRYKIIYEIEGQVVTILLIFNTRRNPKDLESLLKP